MDVDHDVRGRIDAVRVASWRMQSDVGLTAWRIDLSQSKGRSMAFSLRFENHPVSLSWVVLRPQLTPVMKVPTGQMTMDIGEASSFGHFAPQWRWLLARLGLLDRDTTPLRGAGGGIFEPFDPWVGHLADPLPDLLTRASLIDRRLGLVDEMTNRRKDEIFRSGGSPGPRIFGQLQRKTDPDLVGDLTALVEGVPAMGTRGLVEWSSGYLNKTAAHEACFEANGELRYELMRNNRRGAYIHVADWSGHSVTELLRWLSSWDSHLGWAVLDEEAWKQWYRHATHEGELAMPAEEVEVYELMGEALPYAWDAERLSSWASERWPLAAAGGEP